MNDQTTLAPGAARPVREVHPSGRDRAGILLVGGSGNLGGRIARHLALHGSAFRALVRPGTDPGELQGIAAEIVRGDLRDPTSLRGAVDGVETVISSAHSLDRIMAGRRDGTIADVDRDGYRDLVTAADDAGVQRFVFVSFPGAVLESHTPFADAKLATERRLHDSPMHEVIVRPDAFQEPWLSPERRFDWRGGTVTIFGSGDGVAAFVAMDDVAEAVVRLALHPDPPRLVELGGPETMSRNELVDAFERRLGRPLRRQRLPTVVMHALSIGLRPVRPGLASVMGMAVRADARRSAPDDRVFRELGIDPRPVSAYIDELTAGYERETSHAAAPSRP
jgi:NADH dehydrogenase